VKELRESWDLKKYFVSSERSPGMIRIIQCTLESHAWLEGG